MLFATVNPNRLAVLLVPVTILVVRAPLPTPQAHVARGAQNATHTRATRLLARATVMVVINIRGSRFPAQMTRTTMQTEKELLLLGGQLVIPSTLIRGK